MPSAAPQLVYRESRILLKGMTLLRMSPAAASGVGPGIPRSSRVSMNVRFVRFVVVAVALILVGVVSAQAQTPSVNIKFKFQANGTMFDAGTYSVDFGSNGNVMLTPAKGGAAIEIAEDRRRSAAGT